MRCFFVLLLVAFLPRVAQQLIADPACEAMSITDPAWNLTAWRDKLRSSSVVTCDKTLRGDGRCDLTNNMNQNECNYDGGDCCLTTCIANCMARQQESDQNLVDFPYRNPAGRSGECTYMCGVSVGAINNCPYMCLSDDYTDKGVTYTSWCMTTRGQPREMSKCYSTKVDIAEALRQCIMNDRSHGNAITSSYDCGNQTQQCTVAEAEDVSHGCHLHPKHCTRQPCCTMAIEMGWIDPNVRVLPSLCDLVRRCESSPTCMSAMAECVRTNKACTGGCCMCDSDKWYGANCDQPLCWPKCRHGACVAPNVCHCDEGWSGPSCEIAVCDPPCKAGQGVCSWPGRCECFYGWSGPSCETPISYPPCVNGEAICPDICKCKPGWGGRVCDYPLCQHWPEPSSDCGHGHCESPGRCVCEPGWTHLVTKGPDGVDKLPFWWRGRSASRTVSPTDFVFGDTRFSQTSETEYEFDQYNAYKCDMPTNCKIISDGHCATCEPVTGRCLSCEPGYFLVSSDLANRSATLPPGRCHQCNLRWRRCRTCSTERCLSCDPLFVMKDGRCISEGIIEFSSPAYHVFSDNEFAEIEIVRSFDSIDLEWLFGGDAHVPVVMVQTVDSRTASSVSGAKQKLADFEATTVTLEFGLTDGASWDAVGPNAFEYLLNSSNSSGSLQALGGEEYSAISWRSEAMRSVTLRRTMKIPIFDNGVYDADEKFFTVRLILDSDTASGAIMPMTPSPPFFEGGEVSPVPGVLSQQAPLDEARVYIWDRSDTGSASDTYLSPLSSIANGEVARTGPRVGTVIDANWVAERCILEGSSGCAQFGPVDRQSGATRFVLVTEPSTEGSSDGMLGDVLYAREAVTVGGIYRSYSIPFVSGPFRVHVQQAIPGVMAMYYSWSPEPPVHQLPDILRIDHGVTKSWATGRESPRFVRWSGYLQWDCLRDRYGRLGGVVPTMLGVTVSAQSWVKMAWKNMGVVLEAYRAGYSAMSDEEWDRPTITDVQARGCDPETESDGIYCFAVSGEQPTVANPFVSATRTLANTVKVDVAYPFVIEHRPAHSAESIDRPVGISLIMNLPARANIGPGWVEVPKACLSAGIDINGSPFEGLLARAGVPSAQESEVEPATPTVDGAIRAVATGTIPLKITLRDAQGNIVIDGSFVSDIVVQLVSPTILGSVVWVPSGAYYSGAITLPAGTPEVNTLLIATLFGDSMKGSPIPVVVQAAASDWTRARVVGNFSQVEANEPTCFSIISYDSGGAPRTAGGDQYVAAVVGPRHSARPIIPIENVVDNGDGTYQVCFQLVDPGIYDLSITLAGNPIPGSPFLINILGTIDPPRSTITNLTSVAVAGEVVEMRINAVDKYGQPYFQDTPLDLSIDLGLLYNPGVGDYYQLVDNGDGTQSLSFAMCTAGETIVRIRASAQLPDGTQLPIQDILGSPFKLEILPGRTNAGSSTLSISSVVDGLVGMGIGAILKLDIRDGCGNAVDDPPILDDWQIKLVRNVDGDETSMIDRAVVRDSSIEVPFIPLRSGSYTVVCSHRLSGTCAGSPLLLTVQHSSKIPDQPHEHFNQPFHLEYVGASNHSRAIDETPDAQTVTAGEEVTVRIQARDLWADPVVEHNVSILVGFWLEGVHCNARCRFMATPAQCLALPGCAFHLASATCVGSTVKTKIPPEGIPPCSMSPYVAEHDSLSVDPLNGIYGFSIRLNVSGFYNGQGTILRPGGLAAQWFSGETMRAQDLMCTTLVPGPLTSDWWAAGWAGLLPCALTDRRFSIRLIGHVNFPAASTDLTVTLKTHCLLRMLNPFEISNEENVREGSTTSGGIRIAPGWSEVKIELSCIDIRQLSEAFFEWWLGDDDAYAWQPVPPSWLAWEEPLSEGFNRTVRSGERAGILSWAEGNPVEGRAGGQISLFVDTRDTFGNLLDSQDLFAFVKVASGRPELLNWQWAVFRSTGPRYRIDINPSRATEEQEVTIELNNNPATRISTTLKVWPNLADRTTSQLICTPMSPQPVNALIECTILLRDIAGNEIQVAAVDSEISRANELGPVLVDIDLFTPSGARGSTHARTAKDKTSNRFQFQPTEAGLWGVQGFVYYPRVNRTIWLDGANYTVLPGLSHPCCASASLWSSSTQIPRNQSLTFNITARDRYSNIVKDGSDTWYVYLEGPSSFGNSSSSRVYASDVSYIGEGIYSVTFPPYSLPASTTWQSKFGMVIRDDTNVKCPTLVPSNAYIRELTDLRAAGSVAYMECADGYSPIGGASMLICGEDGLWKSRDLEPQKPLACGRVLDLCADLRQHVAVNPGVYLASLSSWTMEVGTIGILSCSPGYLPLLGDSELICGGSGDWRRAADSAPAVMLKCIEQADLCPDLRPLLEGSYVVSLSKQRAYGSVARIKCLEGHEAVEGDSVAYCGGKAGTYSGGSSTAAAIWTIDQFYASGEPIPAVPLRCARRSGYCSSLPLGPLTKPVNWTATGEGSHIGDIVELGCLTGAYPVRGLRHILCGSAGQWFDPASLNGMSLATADMLLDCELIPNFCPPHGVDMNLPVIRAPVPPAQLSAANSINTSGGSICAPGYEPASGDETYTCAPDPSNSSRGVWLGISSGSSMSPLQCQRILNYCPSIAPPLNGNITYIAGHDSTIGSIITLACDSHFILETSHTLVGDRDTYRCSSNGRWMSTLDLSGPVDITDLFCAPRQNHCRPYSPTVGVVVSNYTSERLHLGTVAKLSCDIGWQPASHTSFVTSQNVTKLNSTDGSPYWEMVDSISTTVVNFTDTLECADDGGWQPVWSGMSDAHPLECELEADFCPPLPPIYSAYNGSIRVVPVNTTRGPIYTQLTRPHNVRGGKLALDCGDEDYHHSSGDTELVCGVGPDSRGAWKSLRTGAPADPLHCFNSLPLIEGSDFHSLTHGCASAGTLPLLPGRQFVKRNATVVMWVKTDCHVPPFGDVQYLMRLRTLNTSANGTSLAWTGEGGDTESLSLKITMNNTLEARVGPNCGDMIGSSQRISLSGACLDWMHIALSWDADAAGPNMEVHVNGRRTQVGSNYRITRDCFDRIVNGANDAGAELAVGDGNWTSGGSLPIRDLAIAGVRIYPRRLATGEVMDLMWSERPSCLHSEYDCPDIESLMANVRVEMSGHIQSDETRFPLHWRMGGSWRKYQCMPGYLRSGGDSDVLCNSSRMERVVTFENVTRTFTVGFAGGAPVTVTNWTMVEHVSWVKSNAAWVVMNDTRRIAEPLRCCELVQDWCPSVETPSLKLLEMNNTLHGACQLNSNDSLISCSSPTGITNGQFIFSNYSQDVGRLQCDLGYSDADGISTDLYCKKTGSFAGRWLRRDGGVPTLSCIQHEVLCPSPWGTINHTTTKFLTVLDGTLRSVGSSTPLVCLPGYMPDYSNRSFTIGCQTNFTWSTPTVRCVQETEYCGDTLEFGVADLSYPHTVRLMSSSISAGASRTLDATAEAQCPQGYTRSYGSALFRCTVNRIWEPEMGTTPLLCYRPAVTGDEVYSADNACHNTSLSLAANSTDFSVAFWWNAHAVPSGATIFNGSLFQIQYNSANGSLVFLANGLNATDAISVLSPFVLVTPVQVSPWLHIGLAAKFNRAVETNLTSASTSGPVLTNVSEFNITLFVNGDRRVAASVGTNGPSRPMQIEIHQTWSSSRLLPYAMNDSLLLSYMQQTRPACDNGTNNSATGVCDPGAIESGSARISRITKASTVVGAHPLDATAVGTVVEVTCEEGWLHYRDDGSLTNGINTTCLAGGQWSLPSPQCCTAGELTPGGSLRTSTCRDDLPTAIPSNMIIVNYSLPRLPAGCGTLQRNASLSNACATGVSTAEISGNITSLEGAKLYMECAPGYEAADLRPESTALECGDSSGWSWTDPHGPLSCTKIRNFCSLPPRNQSEITDASDELTIGSYLRMKCRTGYAPIRGHSLLTCTSTCEGLGVWDLEPLVCALATTVEELPVNSLGTKARVTCAVGYTAVTASQTSSKFCGYGPSGTIGVWLDSDTALSASDGSPSRCSPVEDWCPVVPVNSSIAAVLNATSGRQLGSRAFLGCNQGYVYNSGDVEIICGGNSTSGGSWFNTAGASPIPLSCEPSPRHCDANLGIDTQSVVVSHLSPDGYHPYGDTLSLSCDTGYEPLYGYTAIRCGQQGSWVRADDSSEMPYQPLVCVRMQNWCAEPALQFNGVYIIVGGRRALEDTITTRCKEGYEGDSGADSQTLVCGVDRLWRDVLSDVVVSAFLTCSPKEAHCPSPTLTRGSVSPNRPANFSESISLSCDTGAKGYYGWPSMVCGAGGVFRLPMTNQVVWNPVGSPSEYITCDADEQSCPRLAPENLRVLSITDGLRMGSQATLGCLPGSVQIGGASVTTCTSANSWSAISLTCAIAANWCAPINASSNVNVTYSNDTISLGTVATFTCQEGFTPVSGESVAICSHDPDPAGIVGKWVSALQQPLGGVSFSCTHPDTTGLEVQAFDNPQFRGDPISTFIHPYFTTSGLMYDAVIFRTWIKVSSDRLACRFNPVMQGGASLTLAVDDQTVVNYKPTNNASRPLDLSTVVPVDFKASRFYEVTAMFSIEGESPPLNMTMYWKCRGMVEMEEIPPSEMVHTIGMVTSPPHTIHMLE